MKVENQLSKKIISIWLLRWWICFV